MKYAILVFAALLAAGCMHAPEHGSEAQPTTVDIQGAGEWKRSPHMRAYYEETVATFRNGTDIDVGGYEARSFAIFREFARANGMNEAAMIDHLKLIPRQVVGIVKEDPAVLNSYDAFWAALAGPD
jgi:hypothetical protein